MIRKLLRCICRLAAQEPAGPSPEEMLAAWMLLEALGVWD